MPPAEAASTRRHQKLENGWVDVIDTADNDSNKNDIADERFRERSTAEVFYRGIGGGDTADKLAKGSAIHCRAGDQASDMGRPGKASTRGGKKTGCVGCAIM